ncbi:MAG: rRNA maturation RNase YbeY [Candidatus Pacebacteria bacterium]|nr:rRNA maturation RNase YbeY [Candidatus Paceibacterota bacterium]
MRVWTINPTLSITRQTNGELPSLPFSDIKKKILGSKYNLHILLANIETSSQLHKQWKGKDGPADTLAFPLSDSSGEIVLSLSTIRKQAKNYNMSYNEFLVYITIHGMFHLRGFDHGPEMEKEEARIMRTFNMPNPPRHEI